MAIYWTRTGEVATGKFAPALEFALAVAAYVDEAFPEDPPVTIKVLTNIGADLGQIHWVRKYESLAHYADYAGKVEADEKYQVMVADMHDAELFVSFADRLYAAHSG